MPRIPSAKSKDFHAGLIKFGCVEQGVRGSHHKIYNPKTNKTSVIPVHSGKDIKKGTFSAVLRQLEIDADAFVEFLEKYT